MADIEIEIDGRTLTAKPNQTVIQVADEAGIYIPRFCYHKQLSIPANCRMCLVEIEKAPKALPACATPCMPGMKVFTRSEKTLAAQRAVMEFLLINHPLDCPICDQGGECELQDLSMGYGSSHSHYDECKRSVADENLGPLIATEMTRCILCTRCVRFGDEIAGLRELGITFRGEDEEITTYVEKAMTSEVSGNIIDLCPVGALTSKPFRFTARAWELQQAPSISPHDALGSHLNVHTLNGKVKRVVARENPALNETWLSDRDRFSYTGLYHADRLEEPLARIDGRWQAVSWEQAFARIVAGLGEVINEFGADKVGALASPNATLEEFYLLQKLMRGLGSSHIDHRLRETDIQDQAEMGAFPGLSMTLEELEQAETILLIGSNLPKEQPLLATRLRKAVQKGATILVLNPVDYRFNFAVAAKNIVAPQRMVAALADLVKASEHPDKTHASHELSLLAPLLSKQKTCILLGALALHHAEASHLRYLAQQLATKTSSKLGFITDGANTAGAWLAGAIPHRHAGGVPIHHQGLDAYAMLHKPRKAYVLLNVEPDLDCANAALATQALQQAKFVVGLSLYRNPVLEAHADVLLPIAAFTETAGTFVNMLGEWQSFKGVAAPFSASRPAWKILRVLGNFLHLEGFDYQSSEAVKHEIWTLVEKMAPLSLSLQAPRAPVHQQQTLTRIGEIPLYALDSIVRRAEPLQKAQVLMEGECDKVRLHPDTAQRLHLQAGDKVHVKQQGNRAQLIVALDERIARDAAWVAGGVAQTTGLGDLFGPIEIQK